MLKIQPLSPGFPAANMLPNRLGSELYVRRNRLLIS